MRDIFTWMKCQRCPWEGRYQDCIGDPKNPECPLCSTRCDFVSARTYWEPELPVAKEKPVKTCREAVMRCSRELIEGLLQPGQVIDCVADRIGVKYDWLREALRLPPDCKITGVSVGAYFSANQIAIRIACPAFQETAEAETLPSVEAIYVATEAGARFAGWFGDAVLVVPDAVDFERRCMVKLQNMAADRKANPRWDVRPSALIEGEVPAEMLEALEPRDIVVGGVWSPFVRWTGEAVEYFGGIIASWHPPLAEYSPPVPELEKQICSPDSLPSSSSGVEPSDRCDGVEPIGPTLAGFPVVFTDRLPTLGEAEEVVLMSPPAPEPEKKVAFREFL